MRQLPLTYHIVLGLLLGLLVIPPQSAQAQWAVYDAANHQAQIQRMVQDTARWLETIDKYRKDLEHYTQMFDNAVQQLTTLRGTLNIVDEQLAKQKDLIFFVNDVGKLVRGSFNLYQQLEGLVRWS
ncbi:MAG: hypothetical protein ACRD4L_12945 [Pyrinomonadaceae bacterium]